MKIKDMPDLVRGEDLAKCLRLSYLTLKRWEKQGWGITPIRIGKNRIRRYRKEDIINFFKKYV